MFSQELENLIKATLVDGVLEDHEKQALVKRAQAEGVDIAELEIYINSIMQQRKMELDKQAAIQREQKQKEKKAMMGRTCPNCGEVVPDTALICPACKHEFRTGAEKAAVTELSEKIEALNMRAGMVGSTQYQKVQAAIIDAISTFNVPNTKADILDFIALAGPNSLKRGNKKSAAKFFITVPLAIVAGFFGGCTGLIATFGLISEASNGEDDGIATGLGLIVFLVLFTGIVWVMVKNKTNPEEIAWNARADAWRAKLQQVILKARMLDADANFKNQLENVARQYNIQ